MPSPPAAGPCSSSGGASTTGRGGVTPAGSAAGREDTPFVDASSEAFQLSASFSGLTMYEEQHPATPPPRPGCAAAEVLAAAAIELPCSPEPSAIDADAGLGEDSFVSPQ
jgi:hypothetical protein